MNETSRTEPPDLEERAVRGYLVRISGRAWGLALGTMFGLTLFAATNLLVLRGGRDVGAHLRLLRQYLPYYDVSFVGSLIGFGYAFAIGYLTGRIVCFVYNLAARE